MPPQLTDVFVLQPVVTWPYTENNFEYKAGPLSVVWPKLRRYYSLMTIYLARNCPRCGEYFGVVVGKPTLDARKLPVIGSCKHCGYTIHWALVRGRGERRDHPSYSLD
jgi:hypothetical protein